jgi:hypothetical protein
LETAQLSRYVLVYVTSDNLLTDYDIVEKYRLVRGVLLPSSCLTPPEPVGRSS